ncbi:uncharacterized protein EV154DRAFT_232176 [Mucor mucedo]|uniref:uncharacterized protein n=1 Tax=Mucor mucedo TaxID=29922 RepID=UPI00221EB42A|nr:uncharacterized protein EV154DRAFT_232176 [Mucor mucedo]KAI7891088.1 hypothetical protein EV154DRAFT_232176 [Mucor mucedo]
MFQQFKNIFPNASLRSITESVGLPETEWNRGVERLEALKTEFQNLNSIFVTRQDSNETPSETTPEACSITELEATGKLIHNLQNGWNTIHSNAQSNIHKAKTADTLLRQLQSTAEMHDTVCEHMENTPSILQAMQTDMVAIESSATQLLKVLLKLEQQIDDISLDYERQEFQAWKEAQDRALEGEMQQKRQLLQQKESQLKREFEEYDRIQKQTKLELYEANFNAELEDYKRRRETQVSSLYAQHTTETVTSSLDGLQLDDKGKDLDNFLGSEKPKKKKKKKKTKPIDSSDEEDERRVEILQDEDYQDF